MWRILWIVILALIVVGCNEVEQLKTAPVKPADSNFRSDNPNRVAKTGKPQLVELWADW